MSNSLGTRPVVIDTAAATVLFRDWMKIANLIWSGYTADAHSFEVQNAAGDQVLIGDGAADLSAVEHTAIGWIHGLIVPTLDSGKLFIYVE